MWVHFPDRFPHYAWTIQSVHSNFIGSGVHACLDVTCYLHYQQNDQGLLHATVVRRGETDTKFVSAQKVNSGEENFPATPVGTQTCNLSIMSPAFYQQTINLIVVEQTIMSTGYLPWLELMVAKMHLTFFMRIKNGRSQSIHHTYIQYKWNFEQSSLKENAK